MLNGLLTASHHVVTRPKSVNEEEGLQMLSLTDNMLDKEGEVALQLCVAGNANSP
jgi:hypothetical protein